MRWIAISGSGRGITPEIERDVRESVRQIIEKGDGIVTGGVLGVDYISTDEVLSLDPSAKSIKICLPSTLEGYLEHFKERADITKEEGLMLERQLKQVYSANPEAIVETTHVAEINRDAYNARNDRVLALSEELLAFPVNKSKGTYYTIEKARSLGMPVEIHEYVIGDE